MRDIYLRAKGRTVIRRGDMLDLIYHNSCYIERKGGQVMLASWRGRLVYVRIRI